MRRLLVSSLALALFGCPGSGGKGKDSGNTSPPTTTGSTTTGAQPPRAEGDQASVDEGGQVSINVAANDLVTTNPLALGSVTVIGPPSHGNLQVNLDGSVDYTHDGTEDPSDSFTYSIEDDAGLASNVATVSISVNPVNDLPVAADDSGFVDQGALVTLNLANNDSDVDDGLDLGSIAIVTPPAYGSLVDNGNGTLDYDHDGTGIPYDEFTYTISDVSGGVSNEATVSLTVSTSNTPPIAVDDFVFATEGGLANANVLANDLDVDDGLDVASVVVTSAPANGTATPLADGSIDYQHDGSETTYDSFTYQVYDLSGAPSNITSVQVAITPVNDPPTAADDAIVVDEGMTVNAAVLANDTDPDGTLNPLTVTLVTPPTSGTAIVLGNGTIDYTHDGSVSVLDSFSYTVRDNAGATSNVATVDVQVNQINDPPSAGDDAGVVDEAGFVVVDLVANDSDLDDALDLSSIVVYSAPSNGTVLDNGDGTIRYDHDGSETLVDSFAYTIDDTSGGTSNVAMVSLTVNPINDPPVTADDAFVSAEGGLNNIQNLLGNDSDADDGIDPASIVIDSYPSHGAVLVNANGTVTYNHDGSNTLYDSYTYHVLDFAGAASNTSTVAITISGVNDPPLAVNDNVLVAEGGFANVDVLANDTDADTGIDPTTTAVVTAPANGTAVVQADGSIDYTHNGSETVSDSFTYIVRDLGGVTSNEATVTVVINPVNDPPTANADGAIVTEGAGTNVAVLANDTDPDSAIDPASVSLVASPSNGLAVVNGDGTITYTHNGSETVADSFSYTVEDASGTVSNAAVVSVTVTPVNDLPVAVDDNGGALAEGAGVNVAVLANDSDADDGLDPSSVTVVTAPTNGSALVLGDGSITYTHNGNETLSDSFTYTVEDFAGAASNAATVSFTINPVNDPPTAANDNTAATEGGQAFFNVLANDNDADDGLDPASVTIVTPPVNGTAIALADGRIDYTHNGTNTVVDSLTYRVYDFAGVSSNIATVNITITAINDPPTAANDAANVNEGALVAIPVLANDTDPDDGIDASSVSIQASPAYGSVVVNAGGTIDYTHNGSENFNDSFTYTVEDFAGAPSNVATVTITVNPVNDPPVAVNNNGVNVAEGGLVNINVLGNDTDADDGIDPSSVSVVTAPTRGSWAVQANGTVNYTHNGSENFTDSFTYTVDDFAGATSNVATVQITITPVNDLPVAANDSANVNEGALVAISVLTNDTDADDGINPASIQISSAPANGSAVAQPGGTINYTHNGSETLSDSFTYTVRDFAGAQTNVATVNITVNPVNDPPVAANDNGINVNEGGLVNILVLANDTDADNGIDPSTVAIVTAPTRGSAAVQPNGSVNYTHNGSENFSDSFTYRVRDASGTLSNTATVTITITPVNDAPTAVADAATVNEGSTNNQIAVMTNDSDPDDGLNPGSIQIISAPTRGTATPQATGTIRYDHNGSETLSDSFSYRIRDFAGANSNTVNVSITVTPVNDPPVANDDSALVPQYSGVNISVWSNDSDPEGQLDPGSIQIVDYPNDGAVFTVGNGSVDYYHYGYFYGNTSDEFTYTIRDVQGLTSNIATAYVTIDIPAGSPPDVVDDHARVPTEVWATINAAGNDSDLMSGLDYASMQIVSGPFNGTAFLNGDGTIEYLHDYTSGTSSDTLQYTIRNYAGLVSAVATVDIEVNDPSDCVIAFEDAWDIYGQSANPSLFYADPYGVDFTVTAGGLLGGMVNGDPGNWDVEGTNGTSAWGMWSGGLAVQFDEPVMNVSLDFIRAFSDQSFTVYAYLDGVQVGSQPMSVVGAWNFTTVSFSGPLDRIEWTIPSNFMAVDNIRYSAPTLPCPNRTVNHHATTASYVQNTAGVWANRGYTFTARETFDISGGAWWINAPAGSIVKLNIYNSAGALVASGNSMPGLGIERWYHSEVNYTFVAGNQYTASFYTNMAGTALMDRWDGTLTPFNVDGLMDVTGNAAAGNGNGAPEQYPGVSGNSWNPIQRLIRSSEQVDNLGYKNGSGDFSCPANWRLPNLGELDLVDDWLNAGDTIDYYQNIAVDDPFGCICKWNETWCGQPSIETYDGRMCGDFNQLHMCVEDR